MTPPRPRPIGLLLLIAGALIFGLGMAALTLARPRDNTAPLVSVPASGLRIGAPAPLFSLKTLDGARTVSLAELRGKKVLLNFWASWCVPCIEETPALIKAYKELNDPGIVFVGIGLQDDLDKLRTFAAANAIPYLVLADPDGKAGDAYYVSGMPTTIVIDTEGVVRAIWSGAIKREKVIELLR